jgi:hypothetical protein
MIDYPEGILLPLGRASVTVQNGEKRRFQVDAAIITPHGRPRERFTLEGRHGSVAIDLAQTTF